nr:16S rRNA (cytidine(1402)-2'-O)-methyltransferase [Paucilactobacillus kaifaensis]
MVQTQQSFGKQTKGVLYLVPTPIGNLQDMTFRAVQTLKDVDLIAAEDTRNTQKLLNHFEIETKQISFHEHNTGERLPQLIEKLENGMMIAQVSDAGMPSISDPGQELVAMCVAHQIAVVPLPGANAGLTGLIASGLLPQPFYFYGFLGRKNGQQEQELEQLVARPETLIFYEAPHRLKKTLTNMVNIFGEQRQGVLARELTKKHEEFIRGSLAEMLDWAATVNVRGEFVILLAGNHNPAKVSDSAETTPVNQQIDRLIDDGLSPNVAIKQVAKQRNLNRQEVYKQYHQL